MNASKRIAVEFDRLVALGQDGVAQRPMEERIVYYVVATRCEIDIDGFASVYEQDLNATELEILIKGLDRIGESALATEFRRGYELLTAEGFYAHMNWNKVSWSVKSEIDAIGKIIGDRLWELDGKLVGLLDHTVPQPPE
jgi:hypothetical protein